MILQSISTLLSQAALVTAQGTPESQPPIQYNTAPQTDAASALISALGAPNSGSAPKLGAPANQATDTNALAALISGLAGALGGVAQATANPASATSIVPSNPFTDPRSSRGSSSGGSYSRSEHSAIEPTGPLPTAEEFVAANNLEPWVVDALYLLQPEQRDHVMRTPLNLEHTTNLNGVVTSRIKEVAAVDQRLQMFIQLNGLAEGVVDRLSTLTPDQHEKVMESTLKIQKANNPSGVAMKRITDVLRNERLGILHGPHMSAPTYNRDLPPSHGHPMASQAMASQASAATLLNSIVESLTGGGGSSGRDRSRSRPPHSAPPAGVGRGPLPKDIQTFLDDYGLEWWVGEVLARLSLWQRQNVMTELGNMQGVRNPSGVVMARVKQVANTQEMLTIFIDVNQIDRTVSDELWALTEDQQMAVIAPGIYIQNARSPSVAARTRIRHVLAGNDAMGGARRTPSLPDASQSDGVMKSERL